MLAWIKRYPAFSGAVAAVLVVLLAVGGRLFFVVKTYQKEKRELAAAKDNLDQLYHRPVFPSLANIAREREKLADLMDACNEINLALSAGQVPPQVMEAAHFWGLLEDVLPRIREWLRTARVIFPKEYAFGFEKYAGGQMPASANIPRLVQQLRMTEQLCAVMAEAGLSELLSFSRDEFEAAAAPAPAGRQRPPAAGPEGPQLDQELYSSQHFKMAFRAPERTALDLMNRLARLPLFTVVTWVEIHNTRLETTLGSPAPLAGEKAKTAATNRLEELARDKRIVFGREEVEVRLEMDVYNFSPAIDFRAGSAAKTAAR